MLRTSSAIWTRSFVNLRTVRRRRDKTAFMLRAKSSMKRRSSIAATVSRYSPKSGKISTKWRPRSVFQNSKGFLLPEAVIVDALRTPMGRYGGALAHVRPDDLAAVAIKALVERVKVDPNMIEDVF